ncbi:MAG: hypothetical protein AAGD43_16345 [Pseudomonadota bacterium]
MEIEQAIRVARLHELLKWGTRKALEEDGGHKSSECYMQVGLCLPALFDDDQSTYWQVHCYSYVLGPDGRNYAWRGRTFDEAIGKAEEAINKWCFPYQMAEMERAMGMHDRDEIDDDLQGDGSSRSSSVAMDDEIAF